jgi:hypothetical protein
MPQNAKISQRRLLSDQVCAPGFRSMPSTDSKPCRPPIPVFPQKVDAMPSEQVVGMARNGWSASIGIAGRHGPDYAIVTIGYHNRAHRTCPPYQVKGVYAWEEGRYHLSGPLLPAFDPDQPIECAVGWVSVAALFGLYDDAIPLLSATLADWPTELNEVWGPSAEDYFRLKLGVWYAQRGEAELAQEALEHVRDRPANPEFVVASHFAEAFLDGYLPALDPEAGCAAIADEVRRELEKLPQSPVAWLDEELESAWGFTERYLSSFSSTNNPFPNDFCGVFWVLPFSDEEGGRE